jgi:hypothetical protein
VASSTALARTKTYSPVRMSMNRTPAIAFSSFDFIN